MRLSSLLVVCLAVVLCAGTTPVFAEQWCNSAAPATAPDMRYQIHDDGTVTDIATGLMWKRCAEGQTGNTCSGTAVMYTWRDALQLAPLSNFAGYTDWRLPNIKELASLVERHCHFPAINLSVFPNTLSPLFWSASPIADSSGYEWRASFIWRVSFIHGDVNNYHEDYDSAVRLVRVRQ